MYQVGTIIFFYISSDTPSGWNISIHKTRRQAHRFLDRYDFICCLPLHMNEWIVYHVNNFYYQFLALDDATVENGCLWFIPGSHNSGVHRRFIRNPDIACDDILIYNSPPPQYPASGYTAVPISKGTYFKQTKRSFAESFALISKKGLTLLVKKSALYLGMIIINLLTYSTIVLFIDLSGSCILIHGLVVHKSEPNKSDKSRHAYTFHVAEMEGTEYSKDNWLQPPEGSHFPRLYSPPPNVL